MTIVRGSWDPGRDTRAAGAPPSDAFLTALVRSGDRQAYEILYRRHHDLVRRAARRACHDRESADDLTSEVFVRVYQALSTGRGPRTAVRAYLLTTLRNLARQWSHAGTRLVPMGDIESLGLSARPAVDDLAAAIAEGELARRAFASLPGRWRVVLWHTAVEGRTPAHVAPLLGTSPNAVAALAVRARAGLRRALLTLHLEGRDIPAGCHPHVAVLVPHLEGTLGAGPQRRADRHFAGCPRCRALRCELAALAGWVQLWVRAACEAATGGGGELLCRTIGLPGHLRTTSTGHAEWCTTAVLTEPRSRREKPPAPREPTTIMT